MGLTFQQIQNYERGFNRTGSSRLYEFAKVLDVPVSYFFDEMPSNAVSGRPEFPGRRASAAPFEEDKDDPLFKRETLELVRAYYMIRDVRLRKIIARMIKLLGRGNGRRKKGWHAGSPDKWRAAGRPTGSH